MVYTMVLEAIAFGIESSSLSLRTKIILSLKPLARHLEFCALMVELVNTARLNSLVPERCVGSTPTKHIELPD